MRGLPLSPAPHISSDSVSPQGTSGGDGPHGPPGERVSVAGVPRSRTPQGSLSEQLPGSPASQPILQTQPSSVSRVSLGLRAPTDFLAPKDLR